MLWPVVRFPNGSWSYGGKPTDPAYQGCEVWQIEAPRAKVAISRARARRSNALKKMAAMEKAADDSPAGGKGEQ